MNQRGNHRRVMSAIFGNGISAQDHWNILRTTNEDHRYTKMYAQRKEFVYYFCLALYRDSVQDDIIDCRRQLYAF